MNTPPAWRELCNTPGEALPARTHPLWDATRKSP